MGAAAALRTIGQVLAAAIQKLATAGVVEARADAEVLLAHVLGVSRAGVVVAARDPIAPVAEARFLTLLARRTAREPVHYLVGEREFWSLPFVVDARVLIPRPETELVAETALRLASTSLRILDVGTGSGVLAAVLARALPSARVWATDIDADAVAVARMNLHRHAPGVGLLQADLLAGVRPAAVDLLVSNPPYIALSERSSLAPEVCDHEPRQALFAGEDGLRVLRCLIETAPAVLVPGGWLIMEMGAGQAAAVAACIRARRCYEETEVVRDAGGVARVVAVRRGVDG